MDVKLFGFVSCHALFECFLFCFFSPAHPHSLVSLLAFITHLHTTAAQEKKKQIQKLHLAVRFHKVPHEIKFNAGIF